MKKKRCLGMRTTTTTTDTDEEVFEEAEALALAAVADPSLTSEYETVTRKAQEIEGMGWKYRTTDMRQVDKIIRHIKSQGSISQREAYIDYGVQSFHRRLSDIKNMGYTIVGKPKVHPVTRQEYTRYYLKEEKKID